MSTALNPDPFAPERAALGDIADCARQQLDALRTGEPDAFQQAADRTMAAVSELDRRNKQRKNSLSATAAETDARSALEAAAREARQACDELEFALGHAASIGRELLTAWNQLSVPAASQVYTSGGRISPADGSAMVNQTG